MKLLQWNIWFREKIANIARTIQDINPDIACIQEVVANSKINNTAEYLGKYLNMNVYYHYAQKWSNDQSDKKEQGNAILSRYSIINSRYIFVQQPSVTEINASTEGRVYIETDIQYNNKVITVGTTHLALSYPVLFSLTDQKKNEIKKLITTIKHHKKLYFFTGDLNMLSDSYLIKELEKYFRNAGPDYSVPSWTTKLFEKWGWKEDKLRWRLDYVFHTPDMTIKSAKTIYTSYSDHLPIVVEF